MIFKNIIKKFFPKDSPPIYSTGDTVSISRIDQGMLNSYSGLVTRINPKMDLKNCFITNQWRQPFKGGGYVVDINSCISLTGEGYICDFHENSKYIKRTRSLLTERI